MVTGMSPRSSMRRVVALLIAVGLSGCSGSDAADAPTTSPATTAPATTAPAPTAAPTTAAPTTSTLPSVEGMRGERYCEVLLLTPDGEGATATVFSSYGLNDCPPEQWTSLDATAIAAENEVPIAFLNGPRYWTIDAVQKQPSGDRVQQTFGPILMNQLATVKVASRADAVLPYVASAVSRSTIFTFDAGSEVYELTDPAGVKYVMQSWSQQVDPTLTEADLAGLGARLTLPTGWTFTSRTLTAPLQVVTLDEPARVLQDDFRNSYSMETEG